MAEAAMGIPSPGDPFEFKKCLFVPQALGLRAASLDEFLRGLSIVDRTSVYYHLHHPYVRRVDVRPPTLGGSLRG